MGTLQAPRDWKGPDREATCRRANRYITESGIYTGATSIAGGGLVAHSRGIVLLQARRRATWIYFIANGRQRQKDPHVSAERIERIREKSSCSQSDKVLSTFGHTLRAYSAGWMPQSRGGALSPDPPINTRATAFRLDTTEEQPRSRCWCELVHQYDLRIGERQPFPEAIFPRFAGNTGT